jgi:hypothetical protein
MNTTVLPSPGWTEADVSINGVALSVGQSLTLRVALNSFLCDTSRPNSLGKDHIGQSLRTNYLARGEEIVRLMKSNEATP